jgi:hypothetical protein
MAKHHHKSYIMAYLLMSKKKLHFENLHSKKIGFLNFFFNFIIKRFRMSRLRCSPNEKNDQILLKF